MAGQDRDIVTRQIRDSVDIVEVIGRYLPLKRAGAGFKGLCPFHAEKTPSFTVHPARQTFKCFGCGAGGDVFKFIQIREKVDFPEARRMLADQAGISLEHEEQSARQGPGKSDLIAANGWAQSVFRRWYAGPAGADARQYVAGRGIAAATAEDFGLGLALDRFEGLIDEARQARMSLDLLTGAGLARQRETGGLYDTFRHRLMFPIHDVSGRIIGFGGRTLGDDPAKYLNTPATTLFDKSVSLFGIDRAKHAAAKAGRIIVVEGYTDCIMAHQAGFCETVATLGTAMTDAHAALLRRYTDRVILVFDSDEAGQRAGDRAISVTLTSGLDVLLARVPEGKDPCDYLVSAGAAAFESVLQAGVPALEFKWQQVVRGLEGGETGPARRRAVEAYLEQLAAWAKDGVIDPVQKGLLINQLSKILAVRAEDLHRQLDRLSRRGGHAWSAPRGAARTISPALAGPGGPRAPSARELALRQVVEVLLNEPVHWPLVAGWFDPDAIMDPELAAVARELAAMMQHEEPFRLDVFIGRFESESFGRLITDLQIRGEQRRHYEEVLEGSRQCLESQHQLVEAAALTDAIRRDRPDGAASNEPGVPGGEDALLRALAASARQKHFSPARIRRKFIQES